MKKALTIILCVLLVVFLVSCGNESNDPVAQEDLENWGYYNLYEGIALVRAKEWEGNSLKLYVTDSGYVNCYVFENGYRTICRLNTDTGEIVTGQNGRSEKYEVMNNDQVKIGSIGSSNITDRYIYGKQRLVLYTYEPDFGTVNYYYLVKKEDIDWNSDLGKDGDYIYKKLLD